MDNQVIEISSSVFDLALPLVHDKIEKVQLSAMEFLW
jgi:hypothetical protein